MERVHSLCPSLAVAPIEVEIAKGKDPETLECSAKANPKADFTWSRYSNLNEPVSKYTFVNQTKLFGFSQAFHDGERLEPLAKESVTDMVVMNLHFKCFSVTLMKI